MKWPRIKDIFSLQPTNEGEEPTGSPPSRAQAHWQKIKFDNTIRLWIAVPAYLACYVLAANGAIPSVFPMTVVFLIYGIVQFSTSYLFVDSRHGRRLDFVFAFFDAVAMSLSVFYTGGPDSPLYFVYFIPLVVHAFHRDWGLVVFSGFGGVVCYALAMANSVSQFSTAMLTNIGARLFFMLLTVSIACMALAILKKQDAVDQRRIRRLRNLTYVSEALNRMTSLADQTHTATLIIDLVNEGLGNSVSPWSRFLFVQNDGTLMKAVSDAKNKRTDLQQEIPTMACPVMKNNSLFHLDDASKGTECPTEHFSFGSHVCLPVSGAENEIFGVLFVGSAVPNAFKGEEMQFLMFIARSFGLSIQRINRMEELRKSIEMNSWVMAATIASSRSRKDTYDTVVDGVAAILKADLISLQIMNQESKQLMTVVTRGEVPEDRALVLPLKMIRGEALGVIKAARADATLRFSSIEVETVHTFAARAALAIEHALVHSNQTEHLKMFEEGPDKKEAA